MAIVDDYAAIAAELRRLQAERRPETEVVAEQHDPSTARDAGNESGCLRKGRRARPPSTPRFW
jgi:hypothetical protein